MALLSFWPGRTALVASADLRRRRDVLAREHAAIMQGREDLAEQAASGNAAAAAQWAERDEAARNVARQLELLDGAIPQAERREQADAARALAAKREQMVADYRRAEADTLRWLESLLARLPSGDELTEAKRRRDELREMAANADVARTADALARIHDALALRLSAIKSSIWRPGERIQLTAESDAVLHARARVAALKGGKA